MTITVETTGGMIVTGDTYADVVEKVEALGITIKGPANPLLREMPISDPRSKVESVIGMESYRITCLDSNDDWRQVFPAKTARQQYDKALVAAREHTESTGHATSLAFVIILNRVLSVNHS